MATNGDANQADRLTRAINKLVGTIVRRFHLPSVLEKLMHEYIVRGIFSAINDFLWIGCWVNLTIIR